MGKENNIRLRIAIIGTRGIPNRYGGFEQVASFLSKGLVEKGHSVTVYNPTSHPYTENQWNGVQIVHCYDPVFAGTASQFVYDLNCVLHARKQDFDIWLMLGYTSSSVWGWLYPTGTPVICNMDGLEWKRSKYNRIVKRFLQFAEKLATQYSRFLVADSMAIQSYLLNKYGLESHHIAYGAEIHGDAEEHYLNEYGLNNQQYFLIIARMEPENNIEMILEGFCAAKTDKKIFLIGNLDTAFGKHLVAKFDNHSSIIFSKPIYETARLHALKSFCCLYFHGHSVGGTNPSLLEAMASRASICAHDNVFNRAILGEDAWYFSCATDVRSRVEASTDTSAIQKSVSNNYQKIVSTYNWPKIVSAYEAYFIQCHLTA